MNARAFAVLVNAKEVKRGKLWRAVCPGHRGKKRSLEISDGKKGVLLTCWTHHCTAKEICTSLGIKVSDLFDGKPTPEIRRRASLWDIKESLEKQIGLFCFGQYLEPEKRNYWRAAERRARLDLMWVRSELEPEQLLWELRKRAFLQTVRDEGWEDVLQREFLYTDAGMNFVLNNRRTPCTPPKRERLTSSKRSTDATPKVPSELRQKTTSDSSSPGSAGETSLMEHLFGSS